MSSSPTPLAVGKRSRQPSDDDRPIASVIIELDNAAREFAAREFAAREFELSVDDEKSLVRNWLLRYVKSLPTGVEIAHLSGPVQIPVSLDEPLERLQAFRRNTVKIRVSAPSGLEFVPTEKERLNDAIARESEKQNWGDAVDTIELNRARDDAIRAHPGDVDEQLRFLLREVRGPVCKFSVRISRNQSLPISMGDELLVDIQCQDLLGLPARLTEDIHVDLKVVGSSYRGNESVVSLGHEKLCLADATESKWAKRPIFFLPQEQPKDIHPMNYVLRVTAIDDDHVFGDSNAWTFKEEKVVDGGPVILAEVAAIRNRGPSARRFLHAEVFESPCWQEVHKFHSEHNSMSQWVNNRTLLFRTGGEAGIWYTTEDDIVVRHLLPDWWTKQTKGAAAARREFLMDVCAWKRVSETCGARVAQLGGWYLILDHPTPMAGFRLKKYEMSLDCALQKAPNLMERFELALGVTTAMLELRAAFPSLVFLDIKPLNFLLETSTSGGRAAPRTVVLTDLSSVRESGTETLIHTKPYAHPRCQAGEVSSHDFERHATLVTLLQIMLGEGTSPKWSKGTWTNTSLTMSAKIDQLHAELKHLESSTLLTKFTELFSPLKEIEALEVGELAVAFQDYDKTRRALDDAYKELRTRVDPNVTSDKHVVVAGDHLNRADWQIQSNAKIASWTQALHKNEFITFRGYDACKKQLIELLEQLRTSIGAVDGAMQRNAAMVTGRKIAELLCIHLLLRRHANGAQPSQRPVDKVALGAVFAAGHGWLPDRVRAIRQDSTASQRPAWITEALFPTAGGNSSLKRLLTAIEDLHRMGNKFAHHSPSRNALCSDVNNLLNVLHELFRRDEERPASQRSRILA